MENQRQLLPVQKIRDFFKEPIARYGLYFGLILIIVTILIVFYMISNHQESEPTLRIDNFSKLLPNVPESSRNIIEQKLYQQVKKASDRDSRVPTSGAMIRQDSLYSFNIQNSFYDGDFIVDIDSVQQSYIIKYFYGKLNNANEAETSASIQLFCLEDPDAIIYKEFNCKESLTNFSSFTHDDPIEYLLPQNFSSDRYTLSFAPSTASSSNWAIIIELNPPESVYLSGEVEAFAEEKLSSAKNWLRNNGIDPTDYEFITKYKIVR